jgi:preprotein translocase subunit SecD
VAVSGIILYQFGTGPVKGFAVTLMIGIVASLFTAVFFTRLIFDLVYKGRRRLQTLSI